MPFFPYAPYQPQSEMSTGGHGGFGRHHSQQLPTVQEGVHFAEDIADEEEEQEDERVLPSVDPPVGFPE